jgi:Uncharacterized protein conserved in bacteria
MLKKFAEDLKKQRESLGISLMDIAGETKLHHSIFEKMEKGDFDFQPPTYIKAFLKQYAKILRLNPDDVLKNYDLARQGKYTLNHHQSHRKKLKFLMHQRFMMN